MFRTIWFVAFFTLACAGMLIAEEAVEPGEQKPDPEQKAPTKLKDPTQATGKLKEVLTPQGKAAAPGSTAAPTYKMPALAIKARVLAKGKAAAVIDVDGQAYSVAPDTAIIAGGLTLKVLEVNASVVKIEVVQLKEVVILN